MFTSTFFYRTFVHTRRRQEIIHANTQTGKAGQQQLAWTRYCCPVVETIATNRRRRRRQGQIWRDLHCPKTPTCTIWGCALLSVCMYFVLSCMLLLMYVFPVQNVSALKRLLHSHPALCTADPLRMVVLVMIMLAMMLN